LEIYNELEGIFVKESSVVSPWAFRSQEKSVDQTPDRVGQEVVNWPHFEAVPTQTLQKCFQGTEKEYSMWKMVVA
jgi:hypothetical protein